MGSVRARAGRRNRSSNAGTGASWMRTRAEHVALRLGIVVDTRAAAGSTRSISPGPSRSSRTISAGSSGTAPASDASATTRSLVTAQAAGRSPLRSSSAPTWRPSANTSAAGSVPRARRTRRSGAGTRPGRDGARGAAPRRRARARGALSGTDQPVATSSSTASSSERESEPPSLRAGVRRPAAGRATARRRARQRAIVASAADGLAVAADRVDLAVVGDEAERLGERPGRCRVRRVALVEHRERARQGLAQVGWNAASRRARDQALVDERSATTRRRSRSPSRPPARASPRRAGARTPARARSGRPSSPPGRGTSACSMAGREARASPPSAPASVGTGRQRATRGPRGPERRRRPRPGRRRARSRAAGQERAREDPEPVAGDRRPDRGGADRRGEREQDARPVARLTVGREGSTVTEGRQPGQREREDPPGRPATGIRDEPDAARVVLEGGVVEGRLGRPLWGAAARHRTVRPIVARPGTRLRRGRRCRGRPPRPAPGRGCRGRSRRP